MAKYYCEGFRAIEAESFEKAFDEFSRKASIKNYSGVNAFVKDVDLHFQSDSAQIYSMRVGKTFSNKPEISHFISLRIEKVS